MSNGMPYLYIFPYILLDVFFVKKALQGYTERIF
jgi:hypothetical protein